MRKTAVIALCLCLLLTSLTGCNQAQSGEAQDGGTSESGTQPVSLKAAADPAATNAEMFTDRDGRADYDPDKAVKIELNGTSAAASGNSVQNSGSTITITEEGVYLISGTLEDGMLIVDAPDTAKLQLVFDGVNITSASSAPLYIKQADKVFVTLVGENSLANGGEFTAVDENNIDGAVFSKQDLTFNGSGSLAVTSPAGHGIVCKDDLVFTSGSYDIAAASHAIDANDSVRIRDAAITAQAGKDGIHAENSDDSEKGFIYIASGSIQIESEGDGVSAGAYLYIADGTVEILAGGGYENGAKQSSNNWGAFGRGGGVRGGNSLDGVADRASAEPPGSHGSMPDGEMPNGEIINSKKTGGEMSHGEMRGPMSDSPQINGADTDSAAATDGSSTSMKGLKADGSILIEGGAFTIDSADDGIHSNTSVTICGGIFEIASGDDGVHAEDTLTVTAGTIHITNSYEGLEALHLAIEGGDIVLTATDDGLNAAGGADQSGMGGRDGMFDGPARAGSGGSLIISGGTISINASGDGIDSNGTLEITGGHITVVGPAQGDTSTLDYDISGTISGGTFIGTGAAGMSQSFSSSEQGVITVRVDAQSAGTEIILTDRNGMELLSASPELPYQIVILSSPDLISGETYTLCVGTQTMELEAK